ncbi:MATE family efflux transporter [Endozoicomonas gorgoniicola]|uniref:Multidrug-efflux transporter n=1 Tax=Endozoicomonas gorgoniicola TaxID=1234144 RepID=A0ABT3MU50_9GAMM|nr:MATE family efflux transporter [Endozoicomonas gorgoniicola]MCW7552915.1 MATE family efflux transporter [Endozoicomonas gorgoniicola]
MNQKLTQGPIVPSLLRMAFPIIGMSFVQMTYNMVDMVWLGRIGSDAVAAVGTASFITWFGMALMLTTKSGVEITVSQEIGRENPGMASAFASNSILLALVAAVTYGLLTYLTAGYLVGFFDLEKQSVNDMAIAYIRIIAIGSPLYYVNPTLAGIFTGAGNTQLPFRITSTGLLLNIIVDPLFIFGMGPVPAMGSNGAALATVLSQGLVALLFYRKIILGYSVIQCSKETFTPAIKLLKRLMVLGFPVALHSALFAIFSIAIARVVSVWGALPIALQSVGAQIEAVSWMSATGFSTALATFTGQNYGAEKWQRIYTGFRVTVIISVLIGGVVTLAFLLFGREIFAVFIPEPDAIRLGAIYLAILAVSQIFMCMEISTSGAFYGLGKTMPPSLISIVFTGTRIPVALLLAYGAFGIPGMGLEGVWWSVSLSSVVKGVLLCGWCYWILSRHPKRVEEQEKLAVGMT